MRIRYLSSWLGLLVSLFMPMAVVASEGEHAIERDYSQVRAEPAPLVMTTPVKNLSVRP